MSIATRNWEKRNPDKVKAQRRRHYLRHKDKIRARADAWTKANPSKLLAAQLKRQYKISILEWDEMLVSQSGKCQICQSPMIGWKEPCVDHNHETGKVRGLLCSNCNKGLGLLKDDIKLLQSAIAYLNGDKT